MYMSVLTSFVALHEGISNFMLIYFIEKNSSISVFPIRLDFPYMKTIIVMHNVSSIVFYVISVCLYWFVLT